MIGKNSTVANRAIDIQMRRKQVGWETPRNIAILAGTMTVVIGAIFGTIGGFIGYEIARTPRSTKPSTQPSRISTVSEWPFRWPSYESLLSLRLPNAVRLPWA